MSKLKKGDKIYIKAMVTSPAEYPLYKLGVKTDGGSTLDIAPQDAVYRDEKCMVDLPADIQKWAAAHPGSVKEAIEKAYWDAFELYLDLGLEPDK